MEQDSRQNNIEIHCLPEHKQENLPNLMIQIGKVVVCKHNIIKYLSCYLGIAVRCVTRAMTSRPTYE